MPAASRMPTPSEATVTQAEDLTDSWAATGVFGAAVVGVNDTCVTCGDAAGRVAAVATGAASSRLPVSAPILTARGNELSTGISERTRTGGRRAPGPDRPGQIER
ncbi:hypothetical protein GCM10020229_72250 [Kitasatospora albolonga]